MVISELLDDFLLVETSEPEGKPQSSDHGQPAPRAGPRPRPRHEAQSGWNEVTFP